MSLQSAGFTYSCLIILITVCHVTVSEFSSVYPPSQFNSERDVYVDKPMDIACFDNNEVIQFNGGSLSSQNMTWRSLYNHDKIITNKEGDVVTVTDQSYLRVSAGAKETDSGAYVCEFIYAPDSPDREFVSYHLVRLHVMVKARYGVLSSIYVDVSGCHEKHVKQLMKDMTPEPCSKEQCEHCQELLVYEQDCKLKNPQIFRSVYEASLTILHFGKIIPDLPSPNTSYKCLTMGIDSLYKCRVYDSVQHLLTQKDNIIGHFMQAAHNHSGVLLNWTKAAGARDQVVQGCPLGTVFRKKPITQGEKSINEEEEKEEIYCVGCLPGTMALGGFFKTSTECEKCPRNTYQDKAASTHCKYCPDYKCGCTPEGSAHCVPKPPSDWDDLMANKTELLAILIVACLAVIGLLFIATKERKASENGEGNGNPEVNVSGDAIQAMSQPVPTNNMNHEQETKKKDDEEKEKKTNDDDEKEKEKKTNDDDDEKEKEEENKQIAVVD